MKILLIIVAGSIAVGLKGTRMSWEKLFVLCLGIGSIVALQSFQIVFRHIGVD